MSLSPQAVSLARAMLMLARTRSNGIMHVTSGKARARFAVVEGSLRAVEGELGEPPPLGDVLLCAGELDAGAHLRALAQDAPPPDMAAGAWLVERGLASRGAVQSALRRQLRERLARVLRCRGLDYGFEPGTPAFGVRYLEEPVAAADLVLAALRMLVADRPERELLGAIEPGRLGLTSFGRELLRTAALWPEEAAALTLLSRGSELEGIVRATRGSPRAIAALAIWTLLGAVASLQRPRDGRYGLLLRKSRELRRAEDAHVLLDLPLHGERRHARLALRSLVPKVHPDGLGADERPELKRTCNEVLAALLEAERQLTHTPSAAQ